MLKSMSVPDSVIRVDQLTKQFGHFKAVDEVSLVVGRGEVFGLIGPNGAGKSTLIKMLTTLLSPTSGSASIAGYDIQSQPRDVRSHIGYVPQLLSADGTLTGYENLLLSARLYGIPWRERGHKIREALALMGLTSVSDSLVQRYSGGMVRRLEIAQGVMHRPAVLFLDEPTVGLDPTARRMVWDHIEDLRKSTGTTMFMTTHYMEEAEEFCNRVALIHEGQIHQIGTPEELKKALGPDATLDDVFATLTGGPMESGGNYGDVRRTRRGIQEHG
jgi:ABC-2 type transport system ATP-binding protein